MTEPDKSDALISKADALLSRFRPGPAGPAGAVPVETPPETDADFPLLTEVVELTETPGHSIAATSPPATPESGTGTPSETMQMDVARLREEILATLAPELEQRLSDTLKPRANELLDWVMQTVQLELGLSIRAAVRSAVAEAVNESLEKLRRDRDTSNTPL